MRLVSDIAYGQLFGAYDPSHGRDLSALGSAWMLFRAARGHDAIFTNEGKRTPPGLIALCVLLWLSGRRQLVLSEFLPGTRKGRKGKLVTLAYRFLLPRVLLAAQVMTDWERDDYADRYRIPLARLHVIPFYYFDDRVVNSPPEWTPATSAKFFSTGKNACDWDTLLQAADGQGWPLTIVAREAEFDRIRSEAARIGVVARHDIERKEHDRLLSESSLLIVALKEKSVSAGHVRLMSAATYGIPVVLTEIAGVRGYEGLAVELVPAGDPASLRSAVARATSSTETLREQMRTVRDFARQRPYSKYVDEVRGMLDAARA